jgi:hypothetical protein
MNLASIADAKMSDAEQARQLFDANFLLHETINNQLLSLGIVLPHFPLWVDESADQDWLEAHNREHQSWSAALNIGEIPSLDTVDFKDDVMANDWIQRHLQHHSIVASALGL